MASSTLTMGAPCRPSCRVAPCPAGPPPSRCALALRPLHVAAGTSAHATLLSGSPHTWTPAGREEQQQPGTPHGAQGAPLAGPHHHSTAVPAFLDGAHHSDGQLSPTARLGAVGRMRGPHVHQGYATAKGAMKAASQDRFIAACCSQAGPNAVTISEVDCSPMVVSAVFDGHGGESSASYAAGQMMSHMFEEGLHEHLGDGDMEAARNAFAAAFNKCDDAILACQSNQGIADGTTALVTMQLGGALAVANAGDSRAVLCRKGQAIRLSRDHTPSCKDERERIERAGGKVAMARGAVRVLVPVPGAIKAISVSRGFGDPEFKQRNLVICEPEVLTTNLKEGEDGFVILASDGLWTFVSDQVAVEAVKGVLEEYSHMVSLPDYLTNAATAAARRLVHLAQDFGSLDDVTVIVNVFSWN